MDSQDKSTTYTPPISEINDYDRLYPKSIARLKTRYDLFYWHLGEGRIKYNDHTNLTLNTIKQWINGKRCIVTMGMMNKLYEFSPPEYLTEGQIYRGMHTVMTKDIKYDNKLVSCTLNKDVADRISLRTANYLRTSICNPTTLEAKTKYFNFTKLIKDLQEAAKKTDPDKELLISDTEQEVIAYFTEDFNPIKNNIITW